MGNNPGREEFFFFLLFSFTLIYDRKKAVQSLHIRGIYPAGTCICHEFLEKLITVEHLAHESADFTFTLQILSCRCEADDEDKFNTTL